MFEIIFTDNKFNDEYVNRKMLIDNMFNLSLSKKQYIYGKSDNMFENELYPDENLLTDEYERLDEKSRIEKLCNMTSEERVAYLHTKDAENIYRTHREKKLELEKKLEFEKKIELEKKLNINHSNHKIEYEDTIEYEHKIEYADKPYNKNRNYGKNNYYKKQSISNKSYKKSYGKTSNTSYKPKEKIKMYVENIR